MSVTRSKRVPVAQGCSLRGPAHLSCMSATWQLLSHIPALAETLVCRRHLANPDNLNNVVALLQHHVKVVYQQRTGLMGMNHIEQTYDLVAW